MEGLNRIIFLVLGLIAIVIFFAVLTGKINLKARLPRLSDTAKKIASTPSPTKKPAASADKTKTTDTETKPYKTSGNEKTGGKPLTTIPATGLSMVWISTNAALFALGVYLKRRR